MVEKSMRLENSPGVDTSSPPPLTGVRAEKGQAAVRPSTRKRKPASKRWQGIVRDRWVYFLLLPGLLSFLVFSSGPLLGNVIAFQDFSPSLGIFGNPWIGWSHVVQIFIDPEAGMTRQNTLITSVLQILFTFPAGLALLLMLNTLISQRFKRFIQRIVYLPHFLGWVMSSSIWQQTGERAHVAARRWHRAHHQWTEPAERSGQPDPAVEEPGWRSDPSRVRAGYASLLFPGIKCAGASAFQSTRPIFFSSKQPKGGCSLTRKRFI